MRCHFCNMVLKIITSILLGDYLLTLFLGGFVSHCTETSTSQRTEADRLTASKELRPSLWYLLGGLKPANNPVSLKVDPSPDELQRETPALATSALPARLWTEHPDEHHPDACTPETANDKCALFHVAVIFNAAMNTGMGKLSDFKYHFPSPRSFSWQVA